MNRVLLTLAFIFVYATLSGQQGEKAFCATPPAPSDWLQNFQARLDKDAPSLASLRTQNTIYIPLSVHIVGRDDGTGYLEMDRLLDFLCVLNDDFFQVDIQFYIDGLDYINNSRFFQHNTVSTAEEMFLKHNVPSTLNTYFVSDPLGACGYNLIPRNQPSLGVVLTTDPFCTSATSHNWTHEVGHYFSLLHTFYGWENYDHDYNQPAPRIVNFGMPVEFADGSNCRNAADGFCDTPADYIWLRWECQSNGNSPIPLTDPVGVQFFPKGFNYMGYALGSCPNHFSDEQIAAMQAYLFEQIPDHVFISPPAGPVDPNKTRLIQPELNAIVSTYDEVTFEWEAVEQASGYLLEIALLPNFAFILEDYTSSETSITVRDLDPQRTYFWRVRPYNSLYSCAQYTEAGVFKTGIVTAVNEINTLTELQLLPNPARDYLQLQFRLLEPKPLSWRLLSATGSTVDEHPARLFSSGAQQLRLELPDLPPGLYLLQLQSANGVITRKVFIDNP